MLSIKNRVVSELLLKKARDAIVFKWAVEKEVLQTNHWDSLYLKEKDRHTINQGIRQRLLPDEYYEICHVLGDSYEY